MRLSVAIPDSALSDESTKLDKSRKISQIARCAAVFGARHIFVYRDGDNDADRALLLTMLQYLETPPFLRRRLFPRVSELKYAGVLHPLNIPSHAMPADPASIRSGDVREGIAVTVRGKRYVDVGVNLLIPLPPGGRDGRLAVLFKSGHPDFDPVPLPPSGAAPHRGYVVRERSGVVQMLREWKGGVIIATKSGKVATIHRVSRYLAGDADILVVFGSPRRGVREIAGGRISAPDVMHLNFFPDQRTRTVRLEEALLGTLSILNAYRVAA